MWLPYKGVNPAKEFRGKTREKELVDKMKKDYNLLKKSQGYSILFITNQGVQFVAQILAGNVMRKCCVDKVSTPVVSLVA